jgi:hypothetical protein
LAFLEDIHLLKTCPKTQEKGEEKNQKSLSKTSRLSETHPSPDSF